MSETQNEYVVRQTGNISSWNDEIEKFQAQADRTTTKKLDNFKKHILMLKEKRTGLEEKVFEIKKSAEGDWELLKIDADKSFKVLDKMFKTAKAYFN